MIRKLVFILQIFVAALFQSAHLAMIDTLMMAYTVETVSVEKVMACMAQYSTSDPESETPYDTEDAVTTWINKVGDRPCFCSLSNICHSRDPDPLSVFFPLYPEVPVA